MQKSTSLKILVRNPKDSKVSLHGTSKYRGLSQADHLIFLNKDELAQLGKDIILDCAYQKKFSEVTIIYPLGEVYEIDLLLDGLAVYASTTKSATIHLNGGQLSSKLLDRLLTEWNNVNLEGCDLLEGWWTLPQRNRVCKMLTLHDCAAFTPPLIESGCCSWPELRDFSIGEKFPSLGLQDTYLCMLDDRPRKAFFPTNTEWIVKAFWSKKIKD